MVRQDSLIPKSFAICANVPHPRGCERPRQLLPKLCRVRPRHDPHPFSSALRHHRSDVTSSCSRPNSAGESCICQTSLVQGSPQLLTPLRSADHRQGSGSLTIVSRRGRWHLAWGAIAEMAAAKAAAWRRSSLAPGSVIAFVGDTEPSIVLGILAAWIGGHTVLVLPPTASTDAIVHTCEVAQARRLCLASDSRKTDIRSSRLPDVEELDLVDWPTGLLTESHDLPDSASIAVLQPTSGSTDAPRLVRVTNRNVEFDLAMIRRRLRIECTDRLLAWLPLYHDMGLIGFLAQGSDLRK